jgi:hypothetical protein
MKAVHRCLARSLVGLALAMGTGALSLAVSPSTASAQVSQADSAAVLLQAATRFERDGRWEIAEAIYVLLTEQYGATPAGIEARSRLTGPADQRIERISRVELQVFGTLYGLWLGVAVPVAFGAEDPEAFGAGLLLGGPIGFFGSRAALRARPLSEGQARAISWGGIFGTWQGFGWAELLNFGEEEFCNEFGCYDSGDNTEELFASMIVGGLAGITTGAIIARNPVRSGVSSGAQAGSTWASIYGAMVAGIVDADNGDAALASALIAGNVGLLAGAGLASRYDMSRSRIRLINLGALLGGLGGVGVDLLIQPDDEEVALLLPLVTSVAGLGIAAYATRDSDRGVERGPEDLDLALIRLSDDGLRVAPPMPMPTLLSMDDANGRPVWRPGLSFELFRATF